MAGLTAARELSAAGIDTIVLEARDRVGGRVHTIYDQRIRAPIELGAEFVHGDPPEITGSRAREAALAVRETKGNPWFLDRDGELAPSGEEPPGGNDELWTIARSYAKNHHPDISFEDFLCLPATSEISIERRSGQSDSFRGFHAAETGKVGLYGLIETQDAEKTIGGMISHRITAGYSRLANFLQQKCEQNGVKFFFDNTVTSIDWHARPTRVRAHSSDGQDFFYEAGAVIVTLPVGVLKPGPESSNHISFSPDITLKRAILETIEMGCGGG